MQFYVDTHPKLSGNSGLFTSKFISKNTLVLNLSDLPIINVNNKYAITLRSGTYLDTTDSMGRYLNHSCDPNLVFDRDTVSFIALHDIKIDEMLSFDYLTTEIDNITEPFNCICGASNCKGYIGK
jgi:hypothetical protein